MNGMAKNGVRESIFDGWGYLENAEVRSISSMVGRISMRKTKGC